MYRHENFIHTYTYKIGKQAFGFSLDYGFSDIWNAKLIIIIVRKLFFVITTLALIKWTSVVSDDVIACDVSAFSAHAIFFYVDQTYYQTKRWKNKHSGTFVCKIICFFFFLNVREAPVITM